MCGIAGIVFPPSRPADPERVRTMMTRLAHRGPDGAGLITEGECVLGHTRLAILDPSGGAQPMSGDAAGVWITYNGEIYNSPALRAELSRSRRFLTHCDTEVLVKGYEEWGEGILERLDGMFAFAIWDGPRRRLFMARDRLGIKPFLYVQSAEGFAFASEMPSLLGSGLVDGTIDRDALSDFLELGFVPSPHTIYAGVRRLPPGHCAVLEDGTFRPKRYWTPPLAQRRDGDEEDLMDLWNEQFAAAVDRHRLSDVPVGVFLSGGIDSSLVASSLVERGGSAVPVYTLGFREERWDETPHARRVADRLGCDFHSGLLEEDIEDEIAGILGAVGEPFGDSSIVPTWYISRFAARDIKVVLSGDGGDELFAGYTRYKGERLSRLLGKLPAPALRGMARSLRILAGRTPRSWSAAPQRIARFVDEASVPLLDRYRSKSRLAKGSEVGFLLADGGAGTAGRIHESLSGILDRAPIESDPITLLSLLDLEFYLPNDMLFKVDSASMAHSLEVRVPFLDHRLVELSLSLPTSMKLRGLTTKWLLRRLAGRRLPPEITRRPKAGFTAPIRSWMEGRLGTLLEGWAREGNGREIDDLIDPDRVLELLGEHRRRQGDHGALLFNMMALWAWTRRSSQAVR